MCTCLILRFTHPRICLWYDVPRLVRYADAVRRRAVPRLVRYADAVRAPYTTPVPYAVVCKTRLKPSGHYFQDNKNTDSEIDFKNTLLDYTHPELSNDAPGVPQHGISTNGPPTITRDINKWAAYYKSPTISRGRVRTPICGPLLRTIPGTHSKTCQLIGSLASDPASTRPMAPSIKR